MLTFTDKDVFVAYSLPGEDFFTLIIQEQGSKKISEFPNEKDKGFIFYPFHESENTPSIFIKADQIHQDPAFTFDSRSERIFASTSQSEYLSQAQKFIEKTRKEEFNKLVLSRIESRLSEDLKTSEVFQTLISTYPDAFVYLLNHPQSGTWMGASPEIFLQKKGEDYETVALAGTRLIDSDGKMTREWTYKEIEEQQWVSDFISSTLEELKIPFTQKGPMNIRAGKLMHLKSHFSFKGGHYKLKDLAQALHPTPAVCGLPKTKAQQFILDNETHDRAYYTGFLGPMNIREECNLFVNLRCIQLSGKQFVLYLGGGITADSQARDEWTETVHKAGTMLKVLQT
jgi:isochorismate synthase